MTQPVYIWGRGVVSAFANDWAATLDALRAGKSAITKVEHFDVSGFPCRVAAPVTLEPCTDRRLPMALAAAKAAWGAASERVPPERIGVVIGAESGRTSFSEVCALAQAAGGGSTFDHAAFGNRARMLATSIDASSVSPAAVTSALCRYFDARGPARTISLACASGLAAIIDGARMIRQGHADVVLAGGVGADVDPLMLAGFGLLGILSEKGISRPFDVRRDGFVIGEGAAMVVLAKDRGPATTALTGCGRTLDAHHLTSPAPDGDGAFRAMKLALQQSGLRGVDVVQAHGTSTPMNDPIEADAIRRVLKDAPEPAHVSSIKGALGHWVAGAGALGFVAAEAAIINGWALPTAGLQEVDPACPGLHVVKTATEVRAKSALVNAFAFGGANASAVIEAVG